MSGNYENFRELLTPVTKNVRSELFFKMLMDTDKDGNWILRPDKDVTRYNFFSGKGAGWPSPDTDDALVAAGAVIAFGGFGNENDNLNKKEIQLLRERIAWELDDLNLTQRRLAAPEDVLAGLIAVPKLDANTGAKNIATRVVELQKDINGNRAALALYNDMYTFTKAGVPINIRLAGNNINVADVGAAGNPLIITVNAPTRNKFLAAINSLGPDVPVVNNILPATNIGDFANNDDYQGTAIPDTIFAWNIGSYFARSGLRAQKSQGTDAWAALIMQRTGPKYEEVISRNGKDLLVKQADGTTKKLTDIAKGTSVCAQSGQTGTRKGSENDCQTKIMTCTLSLGDNTTGAATALKSVPCRAALLTPNVWKITKDDIKALNPVMIFQLIRNLGFKGVQDKTTGLVTVEDYVSWEEKVNDNKLSLDDGSADDLAGELAAAKALAADVNFKNYIIALIGYINSNPAILNGTKAAPKKVDDFGVIAALGNEKLESLNSLKEKARESLITVHGSIGAHLTGLKGIMHKNAFALLGIPGMWGGFLSTSVSTRKVDIPKFTDKLREVYEHYVNRLATMNKELSPATKSAVETVLKSLQEKEDKLSLWVEYLYKYSEVMRLENNTDKDNLVGETQLKDAYEKYENSLAKYHKRSVNMIDILAKLYSAEDSKKEAAGVPLTM